MGIYAQIRNFRVRKVEEIGATPGKAYPGTRGWVDVTDRAQIPKVGDYYIDGQFLKEPPEDVQSQTALAKKVISYVDLNQLKATSEGLAIGAILIYLGLVKKEDLQK
jgi:hypothetical protein